MIYGCLSTNGQLDDCWGQIYKSLEVNCMRLWKINYDDKVYWNLSQWGELSKALENCFIMHMGLTKTSFA